MLADPRDNIKPSDEAPALPLLVMASSLLDLALRPTTSPIDVTSIYIVEEALATFLAVSLEDQFMGKEGSARLEEIDVIVKALRYDGLLRGRRLTEDGFSDIPSTILTTTVRAELRGIPGNISQKPGYFDSLIFGAFLNASDGGKLEDLLAASSHPILSSVTDAEIFLTSFAAFATDQASFAPSLPGTGAAVIDENGITPGIIYSGAENDPPSSPSFDKNDPMDLAFVCMSGLIFFAMIILIYLHRVKDKGASHEERIRHFFPGTDRSRATADAVYNDSSSGEDPLNRASFASDGVGMLEGRTVQPILPSTGPLPTLAKYQYPVPKLRARPQTKANRYTNHASIGLNPIPEDHAFASPAYFDPENLRRSDSSQSADLFGMDVASGLNEDAGSLPSEDIDYPRDDCGNDAKNSFSRWNQWLEQVMVVNGGIRRKTREGGTSTSIGDDAEEYMYDADLEDINIGNISNSHSSDSGNDDGGVSQLSTGYSC